MGLAPHELEPVLGINKIVVVTYAWFSYRRIKCDSGKHGAFLLPVSRARGFTRTSQTFSAVTTLKLAIAPFNALGFLGTNFTLYLSGMATRLVGSEFPDTG